MRRDLIKLLCDSRIELAVSADGVSAQGLAVALVPVLLAIWLLLR